MVHSSLSSFGKVEGGAEAVIKALMELVGPKGTVLMPSFNHNAPFSPSGPGVYDPKDTPCINGRIPDTFWRMEGVYRSLDPTHPFSAYGHDAERYTKNHHLTLTMGEESPLGLITFDGGYQINIGTTHNTTTAKHVSRDDQQIALPWLQDRGISCQITRWQRCNAQNMGLARERLSFNGFWRIYRD